MLWLARSESGLCVPVQVGKREGEVLLGRAVVVVDFKEKLVYLVFSVGQANDLACSECGGDVQSGRAGADVVHTPFGSVKYKCHNFSY